MFEKIENGFVKRDEQGKVVAKITYAPSDGDVVVADHTFVDPVLRGQGIAEKMLDYLVSEMGKSGKKIKAQCSFVAAKFAEKPEKYRHINADEMM